MSELDVVFVCTGNQFRSPFAEALFARETAGRPVTVTSCGTDAIVGSPAFAEAPSLLGEIGVDLSAHRSRALAGVEGADLVLGFSRGHVERAVSKGAPPDRTFTLPQAVELLEAERPEGSPRERVAAMRPDGSPAPEVEDPIGHPTERQREIAQEIEALVRRLVAALFG